MNNAVLIDLKLGELRQLYINVRVKKPKCQFKFQTQSYFITEDVPAICTIELLM